jgi:hypothetical protein
MSNQRGQSDKEYWHRYTSEYERLVFSHLRPQRIIEFGVFHGDSIAALARRFPAAEIIGVDILDPQPDWPHSDKIRYARVDQGNRQGVSALLQTLGQCDLVIEDGSHIPQHQATCLVQSWPWIKSGGWYILEDVHTSHPHNMAWKHLTPASQGNALNVVLALEHLKATQCDLTSKIAESLSGFFTPEDIINLYRSVAQIFMYKRALLPLKCYQCQQSDFDYVQLRCCRCGIELYCDADSMTCLLQKA